MDSIRKAKEKPVVEPIEEDSTSSEEEVVPVTPQENTPAKPSKDTSKDRKLAEAILPSSEKKNNVKKTVKP
jgi:hypothetical protein